MSEENNTDAGPEQVTRTEVIDLAKFRQNKAEGRPQGQEGQWPSSVPAPSDPLTVSGVDPLERRILVSTVDGDVVMDGYLGLSQTFLAIGDSKGQIKFAAAPNQWLYATDVTDSPEYQDETA